MPLLYHWTKVDPLVDDYLHISPYAFCNWNPIKFVDPDGMDSRDVIIGYSLGVLTSLIPGTSFLRDTYHPNSSVDYNTALANVDNASLIVGSGMAAAGASGVGAGTTITIAGGAAASTVVGAPEGVAIAAGGAAVIAGSEALVAGGAILMANSASNKAQGYNRGGSSKSTYSSTPKTINQLQQDVKKGKAPNGITRFDKGDIKHNEQDHVHFKDGSALNKDGTWKHGNGKLTNEQKQYLKQNGWNVEQ